MALIRACACVLNCAKPMARLTEASASRRATALAMALALSDALAEALAVALAIALAVALAMADAFKLAHNWGAMVAKALSGPAILLSACASAATGNCFSC